MSRDELRYQWAAVGEPTCATKQTSATQPCTCSSGYPLGQLTFIERRIEVFSVDVEELGSSHFFPLRSRVDGSFVVFFAFELAFGSFLGRPRRRGRPSKSSSPSRVVAMR